MELSIERLELERACRYMQNDQESASMVRESGSPDYSSAVVLLRNLGEKRDTTSLEREALLAAVRLLKQNMLERKQ